MSIMIKINSCYLIQSSRDILGGEPVFRGTRVPVRTLVEYLEAGDRLDDFLKDFPTATRPHVLAVLSEIKREFRR